MGPAYGISRFNKNKFFSRSLNNSKKNTDKIHNKIQCSILQAKISVKIFLFFYKNKSIFQINIF
jgi:hypothetical protein